MSFLPPQLQIETCWTGNRILCPDTSAEHYNSEKRKRNKGVFKYHVGGKGGGVAIAKVLTVARESRRRVTWLYTENAHLIITMNWGGGKRSNNDYYFTLFNLGLE